MKTLIQQYMRDIAKQEPQNSQLTHANWMLGVMYYFPEWSGKQSRWLGFVQAICWVNSIYTIDEMRQHIIDAKDRLEKEKGSLPDRDSL